MLAGAAGLHFVFVGFEAVVELGTEAKHFRRSISTATSTLFTAGLTILFVCAAVFTLSVPVASLPSAGPLLGLFSSVGDGHGPRYFHSLDGMKYFVGFGALCGLTSATYSAVVAGPRLAQRMADDGLLPEVLATVSGKYRTPWPAVIASGMAAAVFAVVLELKEILAMLSLGTIFSSASMAVVILILRYQVRSSLFFFFLLNFFTNLYLIIITIDDIRIYYYYTYHYYIVYIIFDTLLSSLLLLVLFIYSLVSANLNVLGSGITGFWTFGQISLQFVCEFDLARKFG